jgi:hypothetical protein
MEFMIWGSHRCGYEEFYLMDLSFACCLFHASFLRALLFNPEDEHRLIFNGLHDAITQEM